MDRTTTRAIADLRLYFTTAAELYRGYIDRLESNEEAARIHGLADERLRDADHLFDAALQEGVRLPASDIETYIVREALRFGRTPPRRSAQVMYRVLRAENLLTQLTDHLIPSVRPGPVRAALTSILGSLRACRPQLSAARVAARRWSFDAEMVAFHKGPAEHPPPIDGEELTVWFGTNRAKKGRGWSARAGDRVHFGRCSVFVPKDRPLGSLGPTMTRWGTPKVQLNRTTLLAEDAFWADITGACANLARGERQALVFLHGFKTSFEKAAHRTAQLKADLGHSGPAAFFAWPSANQPLGYASDRAAIEGSEPALRDFLVNFVQRAGAETVHIIAHSMGNVGLLRVMDAIARDAAAAGGVRFGQIVLAAPDVDTQLFRNLAKAYTQLAARTTLYVAENDKALGGSSWARGSLPRAGLAPPVVVVPGVETINVSQVNLGLLGHSYVTGLDKVLGDIHAILRGDPPEKRFRLRAAGAGPERYWELKA